MPNCRGLVLVTLLFCLFFAQHLGTPLIFADDWRPISQEELKMTGVPEAPGAPAVILYRQVDQADKIFTESRQYNYVRIKILTEAGRQFGNISIPYETGYGMISSIRARTVHTDGSVVMFDGKIYDNTIVRAKGYSYTAKTFTMPDVQVGSIVEYQYYSTSAEHQTLYGYLLHGSSWHLNMELFTRQAKFAMDAYTQHSIKVKYSWPAGLPDGVKPPEEDGGGIIRMEARNVPAFVAEDHMPPQNEIRPRVDFRYYDGYPDTNPDKFWKDFAKKEYGRAEGFAGKSSFLTKITSETIPLNDPSEANLHKLYERMQKFRILNYELAKSEAQVKQENLKEPTNAEELWNSAYGSTGSINWLFLGMARTAGFDVHPLRIANRKLYFFNKARMNVRELGVSAVLVKLKGKDIILDPGAYLAPFGLLPWEATGTPALELDKDGGTWLETDLGIGDATRTLREGDLKLADDGTLEGTVRVTYSGQEAFAHRIDQMRASDTERKKALEDEIRTAIPLASEVDLTNTPDWTTSAPSLVAEFHLKVPAWGTHAGQRLLLPTGLFSNNEKQTFDHANRTYAIYFEYPFDHVDNLKISIPSGWQVAGAPRASTMDLKAAKYDFSAGNSGSTVNLHRELLIQFVLLDQQFYPTLRTLFHSLKTKDEEQVVLQPSAAN